MSRHQFPGKGSVNALAAGSGGGRGIIVPQESKAHSGATRPPRWVTKDVLPPRAQRRHFSPGAWAWMGVGTTLARVVDTSRATFVRFPSNRVPTEPKIQTQIGAIWRTETVLASKVRSLADAAWFGGGWNEKLAAMGKGRGLESLVQSEELAGRRDRCRGQEGAQLRRGYRDFLSRPRKGEQVGCTGCRNLKRGGSRVGELEEGLARGQASTAREAIAGGASRGRHGGGHAGLRGARAQDGVRNWMTVCCKEWQTRSRGPKNQRSGQSTPPFCLFSRCPSQQEVFEPVSLAHICTL